MEHWADYVIFVAFLASSVSIGLYHAFTGGKQRTNEEFIMANRDLKTLPTAISIMVSYMSALTIVGGPAEMYSRGFSAWPGYLLSALGSIFVCGFIIIPWLHNLQLTSVYTYFQLRYGTRILQTFSTLLGIVTAVVYTGIAIYAPSLSLETATGFPAYASIPIMAVVCTVYTCLGGMRAVIWTDVFQAVVMFGGILAVMIKSVVVVGGFGNTFKYAQEEGRLDFDFSPDPTVRHTLWGFLIGMPFGTIVTSGLSQSSVQRYSALPNYRQGQKMIIIWFVGTTLMSSFSFLTGLSVFAFYAKMKCDPVGNHDISNYNQIIPYFVREVFKGVNGFSGLFLSTLYSATLSTASSTLSGAAANAWTDILEPRYPRLRPITAARISKGLVFLFGLLSTGFAFAVSNFKGPLLSVCIALLSALNGPMLGMYVIGGLRIFRKISEKTVLFAAIVALAINMWLAMGPSHTPGIHPPLPQLSTEGCLSHMNITESGYNLTTPIVPVDNSTLSLSNESENLSGLKRFYSLSYLFYTMFGFIVTVMVSLLVHILTCGRTSPAKSFIPGDEVFMSLTFPAMRKHKHLDDLGQKHEAVPLKNTNS